MARRALKPVIEPLSPEAWQRIEDRVFEHLQYPGSGSLSESDTAGRSFGERYRWTTYPIAGLALAASVAAVVIASRPSSTHELRSQQVVEIASAEGAALDSAERVEVASAESLAPSTEPVPEVAEILPSPGQRIVTTTGPTATNLGESVLSIKNHSEVHVEGNDRDGWKVHLDSGSADFHVAPRGDRPEFVVRAGDVTVRVVGTRFSVSRVADSARVAVEEGVIRVERKGQEVELHSAESWTPEEPKPVEVRSRKRVNDAVSAKRLAAERARDDFEQASRLERTDPTRARALYSKLSAGGGPWAANALYAEGRLLHDQGRESEAQSVLRRYLQRYPSGANAPDVKKLLSK